MPNATEIFVEQLNYDKNPIVRDVYFPTGSACDKKDAEKMEMIIEVDKNECWQTIHPHQLNVFDFTFWASFNENAHPGNSVNRNPIKEFAESGTPYLTFPGWHGMWRWYENKGKLQWIGRLGSSVALKDVPASLRENFEKIYSLFPEIDVSQGSLVCGSPGEVDNRHVGPTDNVFNEMYRSSVSVMPYSYFHPRWFNQRNQVWTEIAMNAPDQLRQRVAW